jgi:hypothetical protein
MLRCCQPALKGHEQCADCEQAYEDEERNKIGSLGAFKGNDRMWTTSLLGR